MAVVADISRENIIARFLLNKKEENPAELSLLTDTILHHKPARPVIYVGSGTCGTVAGASKTYTAIEQYLAERSINAQIIRVGCAGICSAEPLVDIQLPGKARISFRQITEDKVSFLLDDALNRIIPRELVLGQYRTPGVESWRDVPFIDEIPFFAKQQRIVLRHCGQLDPLSINEYIAVGGYRAFIKAISLYSPEDICKLIERSGLRGRAGGGYPAGTKWKTALFTPADQKYLICNAQESDPGAFMDRTILESNPHKLMEGIAIAAYATGCSKAVIYVRSEYKIAIHRLTRAVEDAQSYGLLGHHILNSGFNLEITIRRGPGAFVCGEETALIASLEGRRGMPQGKPPYPSESGLNKKPTLINNVESLSNVPEIIDKGPDWFNSIGTAGSKGTKIFAISGKVAITGLIEVPMGITLRKIVMDIAGGVPAGKEFKSLQIGGPNGYCIPEQLLDTAVDFETLKEAGAGMGSGGLVVLDTSTCMVDLTRYFMDFMQKQSCGKCIPCREGTKRMREILDNISRKPASENGHYTLERFKGVMQLESIAEVMKDTSLCGLGINAPNPVLSALKWFRDEFEEHIFDRTCRSSVCRELRTFAIEVDACTGCALCAKKCPANAIIGTERHPFFVVEEKCIACGICMDVCKFNAVYIK
jgi:NADH:ubiquinone oxidoreductase subunit F (NADH-binding)/Pyruvate/2-oxoacid:ferredoxin oxidoreductase delta subunit